MKNLAGANDPNRRRFAPGLDGVVTAVKNFAAEREVCEQVNDEGSEENAGVVCVA